jgi:hypothetical protein
MVNQIFLTDTDIAPLDTLPVNIPDHPDLPGHCAGLFCTNGQYSFCWHIRNLIRDGIPLYSPSLRKSK